MIKHTLTYENFNGVTVTKDFYFHLSKADIIELAIDGLFEETMKKAIAEEDKLTLFKMFRKLIYLSVGVRSEDGESFAKPEMFREAFVTSPAFDKLIDYLFGSTDRAAEFVAGLLPKEAQEQARKELEKQNQSGETVVDPFAEPEWVTSGRIPTKEEFAAASPEHKNLAFKRQMEAKS